MPLGPIEVLVVGFPGSQFNGKILPALEDVVNRGIINIVDALLVMKHVDGDIDLVEIEDSSNPDVAALATLVREVDGLLSDEDVYQLASALEPGDSAAALVFEHTWAKSFRDALVDSGGVLLANLRVPAMVVEEVLAALEEE